MTYNKFRNTKTTVDGITFDSKSEAARYVHLKDMQASGRIQGFDMQKEFILLDDYRQCPKCQHVQDYDTIKCKMCRAKTFVEIGIRYKADFVVYETDGSVTVEDVKGSRNYLTPEFRDKMKWYNSMNPENKLRVVEKGTRYVKQGSRWAIV